MQTHVVERGVDLELGFAVRIPVAEQVEIQPRDLELELPAVEVREEEAAVGDDQVFDADLPRVARGGLGRLGKALANVPFERQARDQDRAGLVPAGDGVEAVHAHRSSPGAMTHQVRQRNSQLDAPQRRRRLPADLQGSGGDGAGERIEP